MAACITAFVNQKGSSLRVLLSTIGSRGDVQPLVALAVHLRELGQEARVCAPPGGLLIEAAPAGVLGRQFVMQPEFFERQMERLRPKHSGDRLLEGTTCDVLETRLSE
jgi:vancomycin aglycone glucosyltransferase